MAIWLILLIAYGGSSVIYGFRVCMKYFQAISLGLVPGTTNNGSIITTAIAAGFIWPITLILGGFRDIWSELAPIKIEPESEQVDIPGLPVVPDLNDILGNAVTDNLSGGRENWR